MNMKCKISSMTAIGALLLMASQSSMSLPPQAQTYSEHDEANAYVGFQWFTGETSLTKPNVVLGIRSTATDVSNNVTGYDISYTYSLEKSKSDAVRAGYLDGNCGNGLATVGLGYSFTKDTLLGFGGVVGSYAKIFGEVDGHKDLSADLELNVLPCAGNRDVQQAPEV